MRVRVVTYATHDNGLFSELVNNQYCKVEVLGFGRKWNGFFDKVREMIRFSKDRCHKDDVIIFLDGFDSRIVKNPSVAVQRWTTEFGESVVVSEHPKLFNNPLLDGYLERRIFRGPMNSGMYMGRAKDILEMWQNALSHEKTCRGDDQCALNLSESKVKVDTSHSIFKNLSYKECKDGAQGDAVFHSFPGTKSFSRFKRVIHEYAPIVWPELLAIIITIFAVSLWIAKRRKRSNFSDMQSKHNA